MVRPTARTSAASFVATNENKNNAAATEAIVPECKATQGMRKSLMEFRNLLTCPLCQDVFQQPTTLSSCAHSFCVVCIDEYCCNAWICPVDGCGMPMSIMGTGRSYRNVNPQLLQMVASLNIICDSLRRAPDYWWRSGQPAEEYHITKSTTFNSPFSQDMHQVQQRKGEETEFSDGLQHGETGFDMESDIQDYECDDVIEEEHSN